MNIILLLSDTFRYDNLFGRAAMPVRTPNLDRFARERAVSVERMYASSFPTIPHRTDLTTGRFNWPWHDWQDRLASGRNHLPELLGPAGVPSQLLCDCPHLFRHRFQHGFTAADCLRGHEGDLFFLRLNEPIAPVVPPDKTRGDRFPLGKGKGTVGLVDIAHWQNPAWEGETDRFTPRLAEQTVRWLEHNYQYDPFLLWVDFFDPHEPWDPPEYMVRRYDPDYDGTPMLHPNYGRSDDYTPAELRNLRAHYAAEAEMLDRWIGRVMQKLDDLDLWKNSIVVFTTDHGICLGDHGRTGKTNINDRDDRHWPLYPEIAHLPFLIAAPGLTGGRSVDAIAQPPDILPTLLDLAGMTATPPDPLHGESFAPLLRGQTDTGGRELAVCARYLRKCPDGTIPPCSTTPMLYTRQWAYAPIGSDGSPELYDLRTDPRCERNVWAAHRDAAKDLDRALAQWLKDIDAPPEAGAPFEWD